MIKVSASDFKKDFDKYLASFVEEEIIIVQDGISVAKVILLEKESIVEKLRGIIPDDGFTVEKVRRERLSTI